jgi:hypothetical protein
VTLTCITTQNTKPVTISIIMLPSFPSRIVEGIYYMLYLFDKNPSFPLSHKKRKTEKIKELRKVIAALTQLALEIETLLAVIKMIVESLL